MERKNLSKNITHLSCVTASTAIGDVEDTEKICVASSNATSSSRLYKSVGDGRCTDRGTLKDTWSDFSDCKNLFRKANHALLLAGLEITSGQRTMSGLIVDLTGQTFVLPVMLTGQNSIVLKTK